MLTQKSKYLVILGSLIIFFSLFISNSLIRESYSLNCKCKEYTVWDDACDGDYCDYSLRYIDLACCDGANYDTCNATAGYTTIEEWSLSGTCTGDNYGDPCLANLNCLGDIFSWSNSIWEYCEPIEIVDIHSWLVYRCE